MTKKTHSISKRYPLRITWDRGILPRGNAVLYFATPGERSERAALGLTYRNETIAFLPATISWDPITD